MAAYRICEGTRMTRVEPAPLADAVVTQRARARTLTQRRKRLWRRVALLVIVTIAMVLAVLVNRDTQHLRGERKLGKMVAAELQKEFEARHDPPLMFPSGKDPREDELTRELNELKDTQRELESQLGDLSRNRQEVERNLAELKRERRQIERKLEPLVLRRRQFERERQRHYFNMFYVSQQKLNPAGQVGVCCLEKPLRFFLRSEGRMVILFDGEHFDSQWMLEREFRAKAEEIGFGTLLRK